MYPYGRRSASIEIGSLAAPRSVIIFHGYTSSPDEFRPLAEELAKRLDAYVSVPLLPGHGTNEADLLLYGFDDFLHFAKETVANAALSGKPFAVMGHSFGGFLAILSAAEHAPAAIVVTVTPIVLPFPLWLPGAAWFMRSWKLLWDKNLTSDEKIARIGLFFYRTMPGIGLSLVKEGNYRIRKVMKKIICPLLSIHTENDPIAAPQSGEKLLAMSGGNSLSQCLVLGEREHGIFYGKGWHEPVESILTFLETAMLKK